MSIPDGTKFHGVAPDVETINKGIFVVGCAEGPKDIQSSVIQAESAAGKVISLLG